MDEIREFIVEFTKRQGLSTYWLNEYSQALSAYCRIVNSIWANPKVQAVANWVGEKDGAYFDLVDSVISLCDWTDCGSNYGWEQRRRFTDWAVSFVRDTKIEAMTNHKRDKLKALQQEQARVQKELDDLLNSPAQPASEEEHG